MKNTKIGNAWFIDKESEYRWIYHRVKRHVLSAKTKFQEVEVIDTYNFGYVVILDNKIQSAEADEFIYHEALVHPIMIAHPEPKSILILGGGEGATLREVLKHSTVKKVIMVDIDEKFINLCKTHLEKWHKGSFNDKRVELIFADAKEYIKETESKFDVIIADISDPAPEGPAQLLYTKEFYSFIKKALVSDGIFVTHITEVHYIPNKSISTEIFKILTEIFPITEFYYEYIPSFSSLWAFTVGSLKYSPKELSSTAIGSRLKERKLENLLYYDQETHKRLFNLPKYLRDLLHLTP
ncbi:MAG: polyamine aminopropyltransferase [Nitrospirae bacterium]|nr:polyamine aminopropyltransferase [Nitrospirota bacterium]